MPIWALRATPLTPVGLLEPSGSTCRDSATLRCCRPAMRRPPDSVRTPLQPPTPAGPERSVRAPPPQRPVDRDRHPTASYGIGLGIHTPGATSAAPRARGECRAAVAMPSVCRQMHRDHARAGWGEMTHRRYGTGGRAGEAWWGRLEGG